MPKETTLTTVAARLASIPFRLFGRRPFTPPQKALILQPCCISQVILTTPLLAALRRTYPQARFDWAVSDWARPAIAGNPHITKLIRTGPGSTAEMSAADVKRLAQRLKKESYDTCIIPSRSAWLSYLAWQARIPQRIGLNINGRGFAHTLPVSPAKSSRHAAAIYLALANAMQVGTEWMDNWQMQFFPADADRTAVAQILSEELSWQGERPLIVIHPGGGISPLSQNVEKRWPIERYARLGNHLIQKYNAHLILIGDQQDTELIQTMQGLINSPVTNWANRFNLSQIGALCELASLFVGNDTGTTHIATAVGCPVLALFGPTDPAVSAPYAPHSEQLAVLWHENTPQPFSWDHGVTVKEATKAADKLLQ